MSKTAKVEESSETPKNPLYIEIKTEEAENNEDKMLIQRKHQDVNPVPV